MKKGYKQTYLKAINNQLSSIMNYAVNFYHMKSNPCHKAGSMGKAHADKMDYWTLEEFNQFEDAIVDKQTSWIAFRILFWTGMRLGEMLALTIGDIDFDEGVIHITKSLTRLDGKDVVTPPKTEASIRTITMPEELKLDLQEYISTIYRPTPKKRIFANITKSYLEHEMKRGIEASGVKKIHLHCLRHSHAFLMLVGEGGTGKSVIISLFQKAVGIRSCSSISLQDLNRRFYATGMFGKLLNACGDIPYKALDSVDVLKKAVGEDSILYEKKGQDALQFFSHAKLLFSSNGMPDNLEEKLDAFYRRLMILEMNHKPAVKDTKLKRKIGKEMDFAIAMAMQALGRLYENGAFTESDNSKRCVEEARKSSDTGIFTNMEWCKDASI